MKPMTSLMRIPALAAAVSIASIFTSCNTKDDAADSAEPVLRFSAIPDQDTTAQNERYAPAAKWLASKLGIQVEFVPSSDYAASVDKFETGDIQLAWFGGVTGVQARNAVANSRAIVAGTKDLKFKSYFIANASTGLTKSDSFPESISNLTFTFGSAGSTSGCIMPAFFILENTGKGPLDFFSQSVGFSGAHDKTAQQVQDGVFQAGALSFSTYNRLVKENKIDPEKCRVIWETPTYADYNFTAHGKLDEKFGAGFTDKLQKALLECDDPAVFKAFDRAQFIKVENATFEGIADVLKKVKLK